MRTFITFTIVALFVHTTVADIAKMQVAVVDDVNGLPVEGARVFGSFRMSNGIKIWTESPCPNVDEKITGADGRCFLQGKTNVGHAGCWVSQAPQGYYMSNAAGSFNYSTKDLFGVWQPDNLVATIRLQRVEHPIPLLVKHVRLADIGNGLGGASWTNCTFRYDLLKGDWLPPFGKGETSDLEINSRFELTARAKIFLPQERKYGEAIYYTLHNTVSAASKDDGFEEVLFDRRSGIKIRKVEKEISANSICFRIGEKKRFEDNDKDYSGECINDCEGDAAYVFRIRTQYDDKGQIRSAHYGKIYGKFRFQGDETVGLKSIEFLYYLNPTPLDRNLEWDMKNNLCPGKKQRFAKQP